MKRPLRAAVIGLGIGERHLQAYRALDGVEVAAVCDTAPARLAEVAARHEIDDRYNDYRRIVERSDIDVVSVCSYDDAHTEQVCALLAAGKHVMVEKPMCQRPEEMAAVHAVLKARPDLRLSSNLPLRTCPRFITVRDAVTSGTMGRVHHLTAAYLWGRPHKILQGWRRKMDYYSLVLGASVHMIDLAIWLSGQTPVSVTGYGQRTMADGDLPFDDFTSVVLHFKNGATARIDAHANCAHPHFHSLAVYGDRRTFFHGLNGAYWVDSDAPEKAGPRPETADYPARGERHRIIGSFIDHIRDPSRLPLVTARDVFSTMASTLAAAKAVETGRQIAIQLPNPS